MRSIYILLCIVLLGSTIACKQDSTAVQENTTPSSSQETQSNPTQQSDNQTNATTSTDGHDYTFLTDKLFHYKAAVGGSKDGPDLFKDEWIDLLSDGTFKAGKLKEQTHTGKWKYNHNSKVLLLQPDTDAFKVSEWTVMHNDQMVIWIGTQTYGNNPTQVKLVKSDVLP